MFARLGLTALAILVALCPGVPRAEAPLSRAFVSKSTVVYLADAATHTFQPGGLAYLPAGTRLIAYDKITPDKKRRLILTEEGLWAYINDSLDAYWDIDRTDFFRAHEKVAIIKELHESKIPLSSTIELDVHLTPSEMYAVSAVDADTGAISLIIDNTKLPDLATPISYKVQVDPSVAKLYTHDAGLSVSDIQPFEESIVQNVAGISKACDVTETQAINAGGKAGVDIKAYFLSLNLDAGAELKKVTEFGPNVSVRRWYYSRNGVPGYYVITKKQDCHGNQVQEYDVNTPANNEIIWNAAIANENKFRIDAVTGQMLVSCAADYFKLANFLQKREFDVSEIPFILSRSVKVRDFSTSCGK